MRCRKARWYLSARCDGTLSERQRGRLDDHLSACPECRREAFYFSEIEAAAGRLESVTVRPDFDLRLRAAIHRSQSAPAHSESWYNIMLTRPWRPILAACSMIIVLGLSYGAYRAHTAPAFDTSRSLTSQANAQSTLEYFGALVAGGRQPGMPSGWVAVDGASPEARRLQNLYLNLSQGPSDFVLGTMGLEDPNTNKPTPTYLMPIERPDDMIRKVSY